MKISYFFNISVVIGRSDMKQKAKHLLQSMLSYPFTFVWIPPHTFIFGVTTFFCWILAPTYIYIVMGCRILLMDFSWVAGYPFKHPTSATLEVSNVHTPVYFYKEKKTQNVHFFGNLYKKKSFELPEVHTRPYTRTLRARASHIT